MIHFFIGTKAQLIKTAPVMAELQRRNIDYNFVFSGQHQKTITELLNNFGIKPPDSTLHSGADITSIMGMLLWVLKLLFTRRTKLSHIWKHDKQGVVVNHGDTMSTLIGTILAKKQGLKTAHLEAGLRSYNLLHPFPEELVRIIVSRFSDIFFAPNDWACSNIHARPPKQIINTQYNTLLDSLADSEKNATKEIPTPPKFALVSIHRFENIFNRRRFAHIIECLHKVSEHIEIVFVLHEPTIKKLKQFAHFDKLKKNPRIHLIDRQDYFNFIQLVRKSAFVITDGGSNQEECYYLGKPCLIMRNKTERMEGIGENTMLSEYDPKRILDFCKNYETYKGTGVYTQSKPSSIVANTLSKYQSEANYYFY